jgi:GNAT superfamily N-acetyltransferase
MLSHKIRKCTQKDIEVLVETIRKSFQDVALRFDLNQENAPRHPSNCTKEWIQKDMERGVNYYVAENENVVVECAALEQANSDVCCPERLAVLPDQRRRGFGGKLVNHVLSKAKSLGVQRVNIGIIAEQIELKNWYKKIGEGETKEFSHLFFHVTFISYVLNK